MSLFLTPEEMFDRPFDKHAPEPRATRWCGNILYVIVAFLCKLICRYRVIGRDRLRSFRGKGGVVLIANHTSFLDVAFLYSAVRPSQWIRFMSRETLFSKHRIGGQIIARVGAFPVKRDSADRTAIKRAARMLKNGEVVGIFPEGTRRGKGSQVPALHAGAALVARMGKAPLMPATVRNADKVKVAGNPFIHFPTVSVVFGEPVYLESFDFLPKEDRLDACTWYTMRECFALSRQVPAEEIDMVKLFPESKDYTEVLAGHCIAAPADAQIGAASASSTGGQCRKNDSER